MVLGIGCTANEPPTIHTPGPRKMTVDELAYYAQCELVQDMNHTHCEMVDSWIAVGNYEALQLSQEACEQAEERQHTLYKQMWCKHEGMMDGEVYCPDCDKKIDQTFI